MKIETLPHTSFPMVTGHWCLRVSLVTSHWSLLMGTNTLFERIAREVDCTKDSPAARVAQTGIPNSLH